ncbi:uncharacterized protein [Rutidosis leptorrhynchoides]|uniref:uncharacterized protein n=1 Tax=Rutidosis leptorrhynchoides TaxID=125765 RepID=UPI003A9A5963
MRKWQSKDTKKDARSDVISQFGVGKDDAVVKPKDKAVNVARKLTMQPEVSTDAPTTSLQEYLNKKPDKHDHSYLQLLDVAPTEFKAGTENVIDSEMVGEDGKVLEGKSFAAAVSKDGNATLKFALDQLEYLPSSISYGGEKVVQLKKEYVEVGSAMYSLTLYGYFVGAKMHYSTVRWHLNRMWRNYGIKDISMNSSGFFLFNFSSEDKMLQVLKSGPWMIENVPMFLKRWEPGMYLDRVEPIVLPLWVALIDLPFDLWNGKCISNIVSQIGKPIAMDKVTKERCIRQTGQAGYARVLVDINANEEIPDYIKAIYPSENGYPGKMIKIKLGYQWKPVRCSHCKVFGHDYGTCRSRPLTEEEIEIKRKKEEEDRLKEERSREKADEGWQTMGRKNKVIKSVDGKPIIKQAQVANKNGNGNKVHISGSKTQEQTSGSNSKPNPKHTGNIKKGSNSHNNSKVNKPGGAWVKVGDKNKSNGIRIEDMSENGKKEKVLDGNVSKNRDLDGYRSKCNAAKNNDKENSDSGIEAKGNSEGAKDKGKGIMGGNGNKKNETIIQNKFEVLVDESDQEEIDNEYDEEWKLWESQKDYIKSCANPKFLPPGLVVNAWSKEEKDFFKFLCDKKGIDYFKPYECTVSDEEDVISETDGTAVLMKDVDMNSDEVETRVLSTKLDRVCNYVFGNWYRASNSTSSLGGTRIVVGCDPNEVTCNVIHHTDQVIQCMVEQINGNKRFLCSFVYASNNDTRRKKLWEELTIFNNIVNGSPWVIAGDFNVSLNPEDRCAGPSVTNPMNAFRECVNDIEIEDINQSGLLYTWNQKPHAIGPDKGVLKKIDRAMGNLGLITHFPRVFAEFLPYGISDYTPIVISFPNMAKRKVKPFRFNNHLADKQEFLPLIKDVWCVHVNGYKMFSVVTKLKKVKKQMRKLNNQTGNVHKKTAILREDLLLVQQQINDDPFNSQIREDECVIFRAYKDAIIEEEKLLIQKRQFVSHFESMLGSSHNVSTIDSPESLFKNRLSMADAEAPGPDGFNSKFYKTAWSVIGEEIVAAVREFFNNGRLLGEVNATLIALVPKSDCPQKVGDYRPISCCNVLYKIISKILADRIKGVLDDLVDENQSAFIPGRQISDNVLLAQELMRGYNWKKGKGRCAFKIDIQKAYDTVNWEFMRSILTHFGFHPKMVNWLMVCMSTPSFAISVNGDQHGYFKGKRGLRQGDPISPYLFTLVMEILTLCIKRKIEENEGFKYHPDCQKLGITHLCFADDLMMFCNADAGSVQILSNALNEFSSYSGLYPNMSKSTTFFGNVSVEQQEEVISTLPFEVGSLPVRYLGLPLISTRLYAKDCTSLLEKVRERIQDWKNKSLSFAGRLQLIKSVLISIQVYWISMFVIPKNVIYDIEKMLRSFLWGGKDKGKVVAKVSWKDISYDKCQGGLGIRDIHLWNKTFITKHIWNLVSNKKSIWVRWIKEHRIGNKNFWAMDGEVVEASSSWRGILRIKESVRSNFFHKLGDGRGTFIWYDHWHPSGPMCKLMLKRDYLASGLSLNSCMDEIIEGNVIKWPDILMQKYNHSLSIIPAINANQSDAVKWVSNDGKLNEYSTCRAWMDMKMTRDKVIWSKLVWFSQNIPRHAFILWVAANGKLTTQDRLEGWLVNNNKLCAFCNQIKDSHTHLFIDCQYTKEVWNHFRNKADLDDVIDIVTNGGLDWKGLFNVFASKKCSKSIWSIIRRLVIAAIIYNIWQERNARIFKASERNVVTICKHIEDVVRLRLMGLKIIKSRFSVRAASIWKFKVMEVNQQSHDGSTHQ